MKMDWTEERPWGRFKNLLDHSKSKVKLIQVDPGRRLSYQSHERRRESWTIIAGQARVILDEREIILSVGGHVDIPVGAKHRLENPSTSLLEIIEVQTGTYFGEDDITRYQDDFNRVSDTITSDTKGSGLSEG